MAAVEIIDLEQKSHQLLPLVIFWFPQIGGHVFTSEKVTLKKNTPEKGYLEESDTDSKVYI